MSFNSSNMNEGETVMSSNMKSFTMKCNSEHVAVRVFYLDGVAVDGLSSAGDVHGLRALQDVVWHVAGRATAVTNFPPLFPVVKNLTDKQQGLDNQLRTLKTIKRMFEWMYEVNV